MQFVSVQDSPAELWPAYSLSKVHCTLNPRLETYCWVGMWWLKLTYSFWRWDVIMGCNYHNSCIPSKKKKTKQNKTKKKKYFGDIFISWWHFISLFLLMAHNWQKWKRWLFLTFPCHKIYRVETFSFSLFNYTYDFCIFFWCVCVWNFDILSITAF